MNMKLQLYRWHGWYFILLLIYTVLLWGGEYIFRDLWEPDEARYAYVAWEMKQNRNWAIPHRYGEYYAHKPPLMFWLINLFAQLTNQSINNISTRLPSLLGSLLSLWFTGLLAYRWRGLNVAIRSVLILSTTYLFWHQGGMGQIDALLCGLQMGAIYFLLTSRTNSFCWRHIVAFSFMGLAILSKGPVGFIIPLGVMICMHFFGQESPLIPSRCLLWGTLLSLAFPLAWFMWAWFSGASLAYFKELLFEQNIKRALGAFGHRRSFYYYAWHFPLGFLPWTLFLFPAYKAIKLKTSKVARELLCWGLFVILFFSVIPTKRELYILAAYPAFSLLIAIAWDYFTENEKQFAVYSSLFMLVILMMLALGCMLYPLPFNRINMIPTIIVLFIGLLVFSVVYFWYREVNSSLVIYAGIIFLLYVTLGTFVFPSINSLKTPTSFTTIVKRYIPPFQKDILLYKTNGEIIALYCGLQGKRINNLYDLKKEIITRKKGVIVFGNSRKQEHETIFQEKLYFYSFNIGQKEILWAYFDMTDKSFAKKNHWALNDSYL
jgi:4-amino-4-deoxy-L-arabinose transferase-like glycosyltransferase